MVNMLPTKKRILILNLLIEGSSMRSIVRTVGVSFCAINKLLIDAGRVCGEYHDKKIRGVECRSIQCDEIWSFCYAKTKNVPYAINPPAYAGDVWTWTALDVDSRLIVAYEIGDRSTKTAYIFMDDLQSRLAGRVQITTDGYKAYPDAVKYAFQGEVDYAQLVKMFAAPKKKKGKKPAIDKRDVVGSTVRVKFGCPHPDDVGTSYVERQNLTMRMSMKRFTRRTNAFSRTLENHIYLQNLYFVHYNFIRVHESLGTTPAVAAGIAKKPYSMEWLLRKIGKKAPKPNRPKRYKTRNNEIVNERRVETNLLLLDGR